MPGYASIPHLCEILAVCDVNSDAAHQAAAAFNVPRVYGHYMDLINDPDIDAVSVATPNAFHVEPAVAALRAGKHVLCEKPLARNAVEGMEIVRSAEESGKILQVALQNRFTGPVKYMKGFIDKGHMGDVYYARAQALRRRGVPTWGVFTNKELQGGGPLIDIGVHILDMTLHLMGYPKPVSASGKTWDTLGKTPGLFNQWGDYDRSAYNVEDFAVGLIRFENGAMVTLESSFMANLDGNPYQTQLFGTKAGAIVKPDGDDAVQIFTEQDGTLLNVSPTQIPKVESAHTAEVQAFVNAILEGKPSPVPGREGLILNAIFDAIYKSSETGREEPVSFE